MDVLIALQRAWTTAYPLVLPRVRAVLLHQHALLATIPAKGIANPLVPEDVLVLLNRPHALHVPLLVPEDARMLVADVAEIVQEIVKLHVQDAQEAVEEVVWSLVLQVVTIHAKAIVSEVVNNTVQY